MANNPKTFVKLTTQVTLLALMAVGCAKKEGVLGDGGSRPPVAGRVRSVAGQTGASYLNFLEAGFNTPWKGNNIITTFFRNNKGSFPSFADTPLSATSVRLYMGLAYTMAGNGFTGDNVMPRKVYAHLNLTRGPVIGTSATNQMDAQVVAFLNHLCARFWNRAADAGEMTDLKALWNGLATAATADSNGTRDVAVRVAATIASSPQALMQVQ